MLDLVKINNLKQEHRALHALQGSTYTVLCLGLHPEEPQPGGTAFLVMGSVPLSAYFLTLACLPRGLLEVMASKHFVKQSGQAMIARLQRSWHHITSDILKLNTSHFASRHACHCHTGIACHALEQSWAEAQGAR